MIRVFALAASVALALGGAAQAASVSYFFDGAFGDTGNENVNQRADLVDSGNTVTDFSGTSDANWAAALAGVDALVIPELEIDGVSDNLSATTWQAVRDFVSAGGNLVTTNEFGSGITFINDIFGTSISSVGFVGAQSLTAAAAGTEFGTGPATLANLDAVDGATLGSLGGATSIYDDGASASVFTFGFGNGNVTFLGYDWFEGQDADWASVQDIAVNLAPVPLPATSLLLLGGIGGLAAVRRRRKA